MGPFSLDACADRAGTNAMVERYWSSLQDCTKQDWGGHNAWCNPPFHMVEPVLRRFLDCKRRSPTNTSATFIIPGWVGASWWSLIVDSCRFVRYYPPWSNIFTASPVKGTDARRLLGPTRWPVVVVFFQAGPLPSFPGELAQDTDLDPARLERIIRDLEEKADPNQPDPLSQIKFGPTLTEEQKEQVREVLRPYGATLWAQTNHDLVQPINLIEHRIHCTDTAPIVRKGAPKSHVENQAIWAWLQEMMECGIIGRSSASTAPLLSLSSSRKRRTTRAPQEIRVCINYRAAMRRLMETTLRALRSCQPCRLSKAASTSAQLMPSLPSIKLPWHLIRVSTPLSMSRARAPLNSFACRLV